MALTHATPVRNGIADFVVDQLDEGSPPGALVFLSAGDVVVATLPLNNPACGNAALGVSTFNSISPDTNAAGGVIAKVSLRNAAGTEKFAGSVTTTGGGGDITVNNTTVAPGQTVRQSDLYYTAPL